MGRLSRAELQERNRSRVLAAAGDEFAEHGFSQATVDGIAERAGLTRGAVYSNFPSKRALYFAVLADLAEAAPTPARPAPGRTAGEALGVLARAWVARLPLAEPELRGEVVASTAAVGAGGGSGGAIGRSRLGAHLMHEILAEERIRRPFAQLMKLDAILLGLALEAMPRPGDASARLVRVAETALTLLHGADHMADVAPGFVEPFNVVSACERLAGLDLGDAWPPPYLPYVHRNESPQGLPVSG
ncbi:TetR/AcrR family transcriptional regulator [Streptomyces sp. NPDC051907]|uniref:TetR/AcrR family transcriptional regulator n=1 Tax=Streptomyces sp. NPDC051907 TaxID=3155284 RepID=UPI0034271F99